MQDWRGIEINVGDTVLYPTTVGHRTATVEAKVKQIRHDKVLLELIRRSSGYVGPDSKREVLVMPDKVTVVTSLPESQLETIDEEISGALERDIKHIEEQIARLQNSTDPEDQEILSYYHNQLSRYALKEWL